MQRRGLMLRANLCWIVALAGVAGVLAALGFSLPGLVAAGACVVAAWLGCIWIERAANLAFARRLQELGQAVGMEDAKDASLESIVANLCGRLERATQFKSAFTRLEHPAALVSPEGKVLGASAGLLKLEPDASDGELVAALFGGGGEPPIGYRLRQHAVGGERTLLELTPAGAYLADDDLEAFAAALAGGETGFRFDPAAVAESAALRALQQGLESIDRGTRALAQLLAGEAPDPELLRSNSQTGVQVRRLAELLAGVQEAHAGEVAARDMLERKMQAVLAAIDRYRSAVSGMAELAEDGRMAMAMSVEAIERGRQVTGAVQALEEEARLLAGNAAGAARRAQEASTDIGSTTAEIDRLVAAIEDVSFRTNLLALNAAVEAARAGEKGAGFAVVADEVRTLAQASQKTAREIRALVGTSRSQSGLGTEAAGQVTDILAGLSAHLENLSNETRMIGGALDEGHGAISRLDGTVAAIGEEASKALLLPRRKLPEANPARVGHNGA